MAAGAGKVALVTGTTTLGCNGGSTPCSPAQLASIIDLVGYGNANFFEGAAAGTLSNTTAAMRTTFGELHAVITGVFTRSRYLQPTRPEA